MALNGFDGNGNFLRTFPEGGWKGDATAGIKIRADRHDDHDQAITNALSNMICKDGQTTVLADIPFNGKKITGLGTPTAPTDGVNKAYADSVKTFTTGTEISGADLNGRLTFTSATGVNGIAWTGADLSWLARPAGAPAGSVNRLVLNTQADGLGSDVVEIKEDGYIGAGSLAVTGTISASTVNVSGDVGVNGTVYASGNMQVAGSVFASSSGTIYLRPYGIGNVTAQAYIDGAGGFYTSAGVSFGGGITFSGALQSTGNIVIGASGGNMHFRPYGGGNGTNEMYLGTDGTLNLAGTLNSSSNPIICRGYRCRSGINGGYVANNFNIYWGGTYIDIYVDQSPFRLLSGLSDYRIKKNIEPLPSTWDKVKALRPISYSTRDFGDLIKADDEVQWGFLAHELQEKLTPSAAVGEKDGDRIQSVNPFVIITALTKALQEAMARIEALEAAA